jgi:protein transport protein SEC61 subunit gamma and related proteins
MKMLKDLKRFWKKCKRVWLVMKKPTRKEFNLTAKVTAIGIAILGVLGFIISLIMQLFE